MSKNDIVTITCYNQTEKRKRGEAIRFYTEGMLCCEGSERDRYTSIVTGLHEGFTTVDDEWSWSK